MKTIKTTVLLTTLTLFTIVLAGCNSHSDVVETCVLSAEQYVEKKELENAPQPVSLKAGEDIYASVHFIESPLGMEYIGKWYAGDAEIKTETQKMITDKKGIIVFSLEGSKVISGTIRFEILYGSDVLYSKEFPVQ